MILSSVWLVSLLRALSKKGREQSHFLHTSVAHRMTTKKSVDDNVVRVSVDFLAGKIS
jgi:hypothetical protein